MERAALLFLISVLLVGCSGKSKSAKDSSPAPQAPTEAPAKPVQALGAGDIELTAMGEAHQPVWTIAAKNAQLNLYSDDNLTTVLDNVSGSIFQEGELAGTYKASKGYANKKNQRLRLETGVRLISEESGASLGARVMQYWPENSMIEVHGNVVWSDPALVAKTDGAIWATPDLKNIGTLQSLRTDPTMKAKLATITAAAAVAASAVTFQDKDGNMVLTQLTQWSAKRISDSQISFKGAGNPFLAKWVTQGLTIRAKTLSGTATKGTKGYALTSLDFSQNAVVTLESKAGDPRSTTLTASSAEFRGNESSGTLTLKGPVTVRSNPSGAVGRVLTLDSSSGVFDLDLAQAGGRSIKSANLSGPVTVNLVDTAANGAKSDFTAKSNRISMSSTASGTELILSGNVQLNGTSNELIGTMTADRVVVKLDSTGAVQSIDAEGEPGTGTLKDPR